MATSTSSTPPAMDIKPMPSSRSRSNTSDEPKLRNSCETCAASKLKCSQDKPTCTRCAKRGLACKYVIAKRGGRKPKGYSAMNDNNTSKRSDEGNSPAASQWSPSGLERSSYSSYCTPNVSGPASPALIPDLYNTMDQTLSEAPTSGMDINMDFDFNDCFSLGYPGSTEFSDFCNVNSADLFPPGLDSSSSASESLCDGYSLTDDQVLDFFSGPVPPTSVPEPQIFTAPADQNPHSYQEVCLNSSCSCLVEALSLMKQLVSSPSRNGCTSPPNMQTIIDRNEATVESVRRMLECSCSQDDGYLLSVMSLIIFKVLGWYATVARQTACDSELALSRQSSTSSVSTVGSYCLDGADSARMAAQLVLSELHHVRRIVHQLSIKLKVQVEKERSRPDTAMEGLEMMDNEMTLPLSATMYEQLDTDLKKRLRALSWEMIDRLRRY